MSATNVRMPDHNDLPDTDGSIVENLQEHPQGMMLTGSIRPVLKRKHPDDMFIVGLDSGIYWKWTDPPLDGCKSPDWFYVPGVPPSLDGRFRRSYVMWKELVHPLIIIEFASGDGSEERDQTPEQGKFWVYERRIQPAYYSIYEPFRGTLEVHRLDDGRFVRMEPNLRGHFEIPELGVELGLWRGTYFNVPWPWLRWFDAEGRMLPTAEENADLEGERAEAERRRADAEGQRAEAERRRAEAERQRAARLAEQLRQLGVDPDGV